MTAVAPRPDPAEAPRHVAIIMDGNGRWATRRGRPRAFGHREGVEALRRAMEAAGDLGVGFLTVYAFSTENWRRPAHELDALFGLMRQYLKSDLERLEREGVRIRVIGDRRRVPADLIDLIDLAERTTRANARMTLTIAFNYGGQAEIVEAARAIARDAAAGRLNPDDVTEDLFASRLTTHGLPDPDLVIRTSGEQRLSNFLIWQAAYAEFVVLDVLWPDFGREHLEAAFEEYRRRDRRFGGSA
jgi:undecaprenyl diphosphate synthase